MPLTAGRRPQRRVRRRRRAFGERSCSAGRFSSWIVRNASPSSAPSSAMRSVTTCTTSPGFSAAVEAAAHPEVQRQVVARQGQHVRAPGGGRHHPDAGDQHVDVVAACAYRVSLGPARTSREPGATEHSRRSRSGAISHARVRRRRCRMRMRDDCYGYTSSSGLGTTYGCAARLTTIVRPKSDEHGRRRRARGRCRCRRGARARRPAACSRRSRTPGRSVSARSPAVRGMMRHDRNMMPSATSPTTSSGWREFLRVIRLSIARTAAIAPRPATHSAADVGNAGDRDVVDDDPGEKRADGQHDAGARAE